MSLKTYNTETVLNDDGTVSANAKTFNFVIDSKSTLTSGKGMSPVEAWLNGVAACELSTMKTYSQSKNFDMPNAKIVISSERLVNPDDGYWGLRKIKAEYYIQTTKSKEEVVEFVKFCQEHCPLHTTIKQIARINFEFVIHVVR